MASITPCQRVISDRFPVASFVVQVPRERLFEIACATDPRLLQAQNRERRTPENFFTSRSAGLLRAPAGQATYLVPSEQLRRFAGQQRLYYALATYGDARGSDAQFTVERAAQEAPCIRIAPEFSGRTLDRTRLRRAPVDARYGSADPLLTWGGDEREAPRPPIANVAAAEYDDGYSNDLWKAPQPARALDAAEDPRDPPDPEAQSFDEPLGYEDAPDQKALQQAAAAYGGATQPPARRAYGARAGVPAPSPTAYVSSTSSTSSFSTSYTSAPMPAPRPSPAPASFTAPLAEPPGYEDGPAARAAGHGCAPAGCSPSTIGATKPVVSGGLASEPDGYEDAPALYSRSHGMVYGGTSDEAAGYEDAPALFRQQARFGSPDAAPAMVAAMPLVPAPADPILAGVDESFDDSVDTTEQSIHVPGLPGPGVLPLTVENKLRIIMPVATIESGDDRYSAVDADVEWNDPTHPYYQRMHVGLRWGFIKFAQSSGALGRALSVCMRRDPMRFRQIFGHNAEELVRMTNAEDAGQRLMPVENALLWQEPWLSRFRAAGAEQVFQVAQVEAAIEHRFDPNLDLAADLGLDTDRALGMLFDRINNMGRRAGRKFVLDAVTPVKSADVGKKLDAIVAAARGRRFRARVEALRTTTEYSDAVYQVA